MKYLNPNKNQVFIGQNRLSGKNGRLILFFLGLNNRIATLRFLNFPMYWIDFWPRKCCPPAHIIHSEYQQSNKQNSKKQKYF
jgi:hypothetical protein